MPEIELDVVSAQLRQSAVFSTSTVASPSTATSTASTPAVTRRSSFAGSSTGLNESQLAPVDRGAGAYKFVLGGLLVECFSWGWSISFGVLQDRFTAAGGSFEGQFVAVSAIGTIALALQYANILSMVLISRRAPWLLRPLNFFALAVMFVSLLGASFATEVWQLILLLGVLFGLSSGTFSGPVTIGLSEWYVQRRGQAFGVISGGTGIAGFCLPLILGKLLSTVGWRWTLRGYAVVATTVIGLALRFLLKPRLPVPPRSRPVPRQPLRLAFLRRPLYFLIILVLFTHSLAFLVIPIYLPAYATSEGLSPFTGQLCLSVFNAASTLGAVGIGAMSDKVSYLGAMFLSAFASSVSTFLLFGFTRDAVMLFSFAVIFGLVAGGFSSAFIVAAGDISTDRDETTIAFSAFFLFKGAASVIGPTSASWPSRVLTWTVAGLLHHDTASRSVYGGYGFEQVVLFVGTVMAATSIVVLISAVVRNKSKTL